MTCQLDKLTGQACAVLKGASVAVGTLVSNRGKEGVEEVALFTSLAMSRGPAVAVQNETYVSIVNLNDIKARLQRTLQTSNPRNLEVFNILQRHLLGRGMVLVPGNGTRSNDFIGPTADFSCGNSAAPEPWSDCRSFAAGVSELDSDELTLRVSKLDGLAERLDLAVLPESGVFGCDAT